VRPLVTIITPTCNHEQFLPHCIKSVLAQSIPDWEQIIVDDFSEDNTYEIASRFSKDDSRIRVFRNPRREGPCGLGASYNAALHEAQGEFIAILEGDDYWYPWKLERQLPCFDDATVVLSHGRMVEKRGNRMVLLGGACRPYGERGPDLTDLILENTVGAVTAVMRKESLLKIRGFWHPQGAVNVDYPTWLRLHRLGEFAFVPAALGVYRRHAQQLTALYHQTMEGRIVYEFVERFLEELSAGELASLRMKHVQAVQSARLALDALRNGNRRSCLKLDMRALSLGNWPTRWWAASMLCRMFFPREA
jgi:glycosyltransferase involved in cell wall biosynthesis